MCENRCPVGIFTTAASTFITFVACGPQCGPDEKSASRRWHQNRLNYLICLGSPGWIRTSDHSINSRMLYR
jgi:hypothetical protein